MGNQVVFGKWRIEWSFNSLIALLIGALIVLAVYTSQDGSHILVVVEDHVETTNPLRECDLFSGRWVYDNKSSPLYNERDCSFMLDDFACEKFGRKDLRYQHWRWQPHDCQLPRFDAREMLEMLRGKRLVFVGDSLNRNQWVSMVCLVESIIPSDHKSFHLNGSLYSFKAMEYNASIDFYWAPFLVESNCDNPFHHRVKYRIARVGAIERHARHWTDADILVFDSYIWWLEETMKVLLETTERPNGVVEEMELLSRYEMGLKTWADWVVNHVDTSKTQMFFVSMSPSHLRSEEWNPTDKGNCCNQTEPISKDGYWGSLSKPQMMGVVESSIRSLEMKGVKVQILNITQLSEYRKDGHPSIYRRQWVNLTEEQLSNPTSYADCGHWCLPGVPDVWNQLLFAYLSYYS